MAQKANRSGCGRTIYMVKHASGQDVGFCCEKCGYWYCPKCCDVGGLFSSTGKCPRCGGKTVQKG